MRNFRELNVWIESMEIAESVYAINSELPEYEKSGNKDFKCLPKISLGTSSELEMHGLLTTPISY